MSRKRTIALTVALTIAISGIVILATLAVIENVKNIPANVISVWVLVPDKGPDLWEVQFELSDRNAYTSEPVSIRPTLSLGDPVCVRMHTRGWAAPKYQITPDTSCWDGAVTPLRAPD